MHSSFVISNKSFLFSEIEKSISPELVSYFDGTGFDSFSKLVNTCVETADTEIVIIMSDKVRPSKDNVDKVVNLLNDGYALVALYRFAFFGFKKELFRRIGPMDERFVGGGYEDDDFYIRLREANLGIYINEEVRYLKSTSSWNYSYSKSHFENKWLSPNSPGKLVRNLDEEKYNYNLGESIPTKFLPWKDSVIDAWRVRKLFKNYKLRLINGDSLE